MQWLKIVALGAVLGACADPEGKFTDFVRRDDASRHRDAGAGGDAAAWDGGESGFPTPEQMNGTYLLFVSTVLGPTTPIINLVEAKATPSADGLALKMRFRSLSYKDRKTAVSPFSEWKDATIDAKGQFSFEDRTTTPPEANAVRPDTESVANLVFSATLADASFDKTPERSLQFWCGKVTGTLIEPVDGLSLEGSTFAWSRVVDPNNYPDAVLDCAMTPAEPLK